MVRAQIEAEEQAKKGEYKTAGVIMDSIGASLQKRGHEQLGGMARGLSARVSSNSLYAASTGYLRSVQTAGTRAYAVSAMDDQAKADLVSTGSVALSNSTMDSMVASFSEPSAVPALDPSPFGGLGAFPVQPDLGTITGPSGWAGSASGAAVPQQVTSWTIGGPVAVGQSIPLTSPVAEVPVEAPKSLKRRISQGKSKTRW
jgi:hypothetical protein